jgi:hypothetical protein
MRLISDFVIYAPDRDVGVDRPFWQGEFNLANVNNHCAGRPGSETPENFNLVVGETSAP